MNDLIIEELNKIKELKDNIKLDDLEHTAKRQKILVYVNIHCLLFLKDYISDICHFC